MILLNGNPVPTTVFPDNTPQVWKLNSKILTETNYAIVTWKYVHGGEFLELAQLKDLLDLHDITAALKLTYLPFGRQDKEVSNDATFGLHTFARLLNSLSFQEVIIEDPHSHVALDLIENSRAVYPTYQVMDVLEKNHIDLICYPDKGALAKYTEVYLETPYIYGEKVRDQLTGNITSYTLVGDPSGKNVLIVDDICDFGRTFIILAKDLFAAGAKEVHLFVTHGLFSGGLKVLKDAGIKSIYTKNGKKIEDRINGPV